MQIRSNSNAALTFTRLVPSQIFSKFPSIMSDTEALDDFIYSLAQAIILFGPIADSRYEYTASDVCQHLNPSRVSRRQPAVVYEYDLETGLCELSIRNSLKSIFPLQLEFIRNTEGSGASIRHFYKIKFLTSLSVGHLSIDSLAAAIKEKIEFEESKKRKRLAPATADPAPAPAPAPAPQPVPLPPPAPQAAPLAGPAPELHNILGADAIEEAFSALTPFEQGAIVRKYLGLHSEKPIKAKVGNNRGATFIPITSMVIKSSSLNNGTAGKNRLAYMKRMPDKKVMASCPDYC